MNHRKATPANGTKFSASCDRPCVGGEPGAGLQRVGRNGAPKQPEDREHEKGKDDARDGGGLRGFQTRAGESAILRHRHKSLLLQRSRSLKRRPTRKMRSVFDFSGMPAQALGVRDMGERQILRIDEISLDFAIEQAQFAEQRGMPVRRERLHQVFDHRPQPSYNLQIVRAAGADLAECEMHKILPVGRPENHAQLSGFVKISSVRR